MRQKGKATELLIPLISFIIGFFALSIIGIASNSFWFRSVCDVPILKSPSVYIGDSIFVPLFNYFLYKLYIKTKSLINYKKYRGSLIIYLTSAFLFSTVVIYKQHIAWTKDELTGFIDLEFNKLSFGGWYHIVFASIEMTIMLLFIWLFSVIVLEKNSMGFSYSKWLFLIFFLYSFCSVLDFMVKIYYILNEANLFKALKEYYSELKVFYIGVLLMTFYFIIAKTAVWRKIRQRNF